MGPSASIGTREKPGLRRFGLLYLLLVGLPLAGVALVLWAGAGLEPRPLSGARGEGPHTTPGSLPSLLLLLTQIAVIIAVARLAGRILRKLGQPQVIGEMAAGILLGPSLLGAIAPEFWSALFTPESLGYLNALSQVGVVLFMFVVGLELNPAIMQGHQHVALLTSHTSITANTCSICRQFYPARFRYNPCWWKTHRATYRVSAWRSTRSS